MHVTNLQNTNTKYMHVINACTNTKYMHVTFKILIFKIQIQNTNSKYKIQNTNDVKCALSLVRSWPDQHFNKKIEIYIPISFGV
jgi:hypothetical protein